MTELRCSKCARVLPVAGFARDRSKASGRKSHCRECDNDKSRRWYARNRERKIAAVKARTARIRAERGAG